MRQIIRNANGKRYVCRPTKNGVWYIFWSENRRSKRTSTGQKEEAAADAFLDEWLKLDGEEASDDLTCSDLWELKYGDKVPGDGDYYVREAVLPYFGDMLPRDVTPQVEARYKAQRNVAASTLRKELSMLRATWNHAVNKKGIPFTVNDLPDMDPLPAPSPPRDRWLRDAEVERLLAAAEKGSRVWAFLHIALEAPARRTAIQELTWADNIDWDIGVIHFLKPGQKQTRKRRASVPISDRLRPVLEYMLEHKKDPYVIGAGARINGAVHRVATAAKVEGVTPHVLRHTAATRMARAGVPLWLIAKVLGNTVEQVEKVYAKHSPEMLVDAVNAISGR